MMRIFRFRFNNIRLARRKTTISMKKKMHPGIILYCTLCMLLCGCSQSSTSGSSPESGVIIAPIPFVSTSPEAPKTAFANPVTSPTEVPPYLQAPNNTPSPPTTSPPGISHTTEPTSTPTDCPTQVPTTEPTQVPTTEPTQAPTTEPTQVPTTEPTQAPTTEPTQAPTTEPTQAPTTEPTPILSLRDNTSYCPIPEAPGILLAGNDVTQIDYSHHSDGYIMARYFGGCPKVKMIINGPNSYKCTYDLNSSQFLAFPLTAGNGTYSIGIYENIEGNSYATAYTIDISVDITNSLNPFLRPNQYVNYHSGTYAVALAAQLCATATNDLECVNAIYNYLITNISYDQEKAVAASGGSLSGYLPQIDASLLAGKGICVDYAAIMTCMLRSQRIPTRLEVGYAGGVYHAWISTYVADVGWINNIIYFDGQNWQRMDPTFGASTNEADLKKFIGDGSNYTVKYIY